MAKEEKSVSTPTKKSSKKESNPKLTSTWDLVKKSWEVFKENWKGYVLYQLLALAALILPIIGLMVVFFKDNLTELRNYAEIGTDMDPEKVLEIMKNFFTNPVAILLIVLIFVVSAVINLGYAKYIYQRFVGKDELNIKESLSYAFNNFLPYLWVSVLVGLSVLGGILLLVVPGLVFIVWFVFFTAVFVAEELRGTDVLKRSKELVKGYFWPITGRLLLFFVSISVIDNIMTKLSETNDALLLVLTPVQIVFSFIVSVLGIVFIYQIYQDLKAIKK